MEVRRRRHELRKRACSPELVDLPQRIGELLVGGEELSS
jgi:hypothetical protein